jgi:hypothetical protein
MGTVTDWIGVVLAGAVYGGAMLFVFLRNRRDSKLQPHVVRTVVLLWIFAGLLFGMVIHFHFSQALRWPLIVVTLGAFAAFVVAVIYLRIKHPGVLRPYR